MIRAITLCTATILLSASMGGCEQKNPAESTESATAPQRTAAAPPSATASAAPKVEAPPSDVPAELEGANAKLDGVDGNGLKAKKLACKGAGNVLTLMGNVAGLSTQKDALEGCVKGPETPRVYWVSKDNKTSDIRVADASSPEVAHCIADAIAKISVDLEVTCIATLDLGGAAKK